MPINDPKRIFDGFGDQSAGCNTGVHPTYVGTSQAAKLVNCTVRGGMVGTRPGIRNIPLVFSNNEDQVNFERYSIQGGGYYQHPTPGGVICCSVGGRVFQVYPRGQVSDITPEGDAGNSRILPQAWGVQANEFYILQNGQDEAYIVEGTTARRPDPNKQVLVSNDPPTYEPANEVPVGTIMGSGQNRLIITKPDFRTFIIGDIAGGATSILDFSESLYLNEAPSFKINESFGKIAAITFLAQQDTAAGVGPLLIICTNGVIAMDITVLRTEWLNTDISRTVLIDVGGAAASTAKINGDVYFRSAQGGIRSLRMARAEYNGYGNTPMSREVTEFLDYDTAFWLNFAQMAVFDNRLFCTTSPQVEDGRIYHRGMVALDFDIVRGIQSKAPPAWEGLWTGIRPVIFAVGDYESESRFLTLCNDTDGLNRMYEITTTERIDIDQTPIESKIETRAFDFQSAFSIKELIGLDLWVRDIAGATVIQVYWRPDDYEEWTYWHEFDLCPNGTAICSTGQCVTLGDTAQARARLQLGNPPKSCTSDGSATALAFGYTFQIQFKITGYCKIVRMRLHAKQTSEPTTQLCKPIISCAAMVSCPGDDYSYDITLGSQAQDVDTVVVTQTFEGPFPEVWTLLDYLDMLVEGVAWSINTPGGVFYAKGVIQGNRMVGLPESLPVWHSSLRITTYSVDPWIDGGGTFYYS